MKRNAVAVLVAVLVAGITGCSTSGGDSTEPVELSVWAGFTGGPQTAFEALVDNYNASQDDVHVTLEITPWGSIAKTLPAAWSTGQGPDLATPSPDPNVLANYLEVNALLPIDNIGDGEGQINVDDLLPQPIEQYTVDGELYAVPANAAALQLYYNKDLLAAGGFDAPPATVEELQTMAAALTGDGVNGLAVADHGSIQVWAVLQWMAGGDVVDDDFCAAVATDESVEALESWAQLAIDGVFPVGLDGAGADALFSAGQAAFQLNGPWAAPGFENAGIDFGIAPVPTGVDGQVTLATGAPLAISAKTEHPKEAQEFLAYWTGEKAQRQFALDSGFPPVRTDLVDDPEIAENPVVQQFAEALTDARLFLPGVPSASEVITKAWTPLIQEITRGADVRESAETAAARIDDLTGCQ